MEKNKFITLNFVKENIYDIGEKIDFILNQDFKNDYFKGTIIAIGDFDYAEKLESVLDRWLKPYEITDITPEDLIREPFYIVKLHTKFKEKKAGETIVVCQSFIDENKTKDAEDESFAIYIEMNLQSKNDEFEDKAFVLEYLTKILSEKKLQPQIRLLKEYDEKDLKIILDSLHYYIKTDRKDKEIEKSIVNLLRGATDREIIENSLHSRRYEVFISTVEVRQIICVPLVKFNRKEIKFKY